MLTIEEYIAQGVQYAIVSDLVSNNYIVGGEQATRYPKKAAKYREFYHALETSAVLIKEFKPSETIQGPTLRIYGLQNLN